MYIFLDDIRNQPSDAVLRRTAEEAQDWLANGQVTRISFDHDLGTDLTGYDEGKRMVEWVAEGRIPLPQCKVHSANPVEGQNIEATLSSAHWVSKLLD